jgi:hypothetical protein
MSKNKVLPGYQNKSSFALDAAPKPYYLGVSIHMSAPSCLDGPAWPCTGALCPCICRQPPGKHQRSHRLRIRRALASEVRLSCPVPNFSAACLAAEVRFRDHIGRGHLFPRLHSIQTIGKTYLRRPHESECHVARLNPCPSFISATRKHGIFPKANARILEDELTRLHRRRDHGGGKVPNVFKLAAVYDWVSFVFLLL